MKKPQFILLILLLVSSTLWSQQKKSVLWIGNSYIYTNDLPATTASLALSLGDTLLNSSNAIGGYTLNQHNTNATTLSLIAQQPWDYVVLQEQSQMPSFSPGQVATDVLPYADSLARKVTENDSCTVLLFFMTWGRKNGDASNCASYPPICTYAGMQQRLRESYLIMGSRFHPEVAPVGAAWLQTRDTLPLVELYNPDESHPSVYGTYLAACVFYSSIFKKSPVSASWYPSPITAQEALSIQQIARRVVLDSLGNWYMDTLAPQANFHIDTQNGNTVSFLNLSSHHWQQQWDFGDGTQDTASAPTHTFPGPGHYAVTLTVSRRCETATYVDSVIISAPTRRINDAAPNVSLQYDAAHAQLRIRMEQASRETSEYRITDVQGRTLKQGKLNDTETLISTADLPAALVVFECGSYRRKILLY